jgi:hypothetical protein
MGAAYAKPGKRPKPATDEVIGKSRRSLRWIVPVMADFKKRFPHGAAAELAYRSGRSVRICETWLSGKGAPDGEAIHRLQNSDVGDLIWLAMTRGNPHPWAKNLRRQIEITRVLDQQIELDLRLKALQRGEEI